MLNQLFVSILKQSVKQDISLFKTVLVSLNRCLSCGGLRDMGLTSMAVVNSASLRIIS